MWLSHDQRGKPNSRSNLKKRIKTHYSGNAAGSTLRRTLGVLLSCSSGFPLRRVGSGSRMTFTHPGEQW
ncbi:GIY-YIG nuclease family protein, partial [Enterobacter cloacae]